MKIKITSHRGDHQCDVAPEIGEAIFKKLTGKMDDPLPESFRDQIPDTFEELTALWAKGPGGYTAISQDENGEMIGMKNFMLSAETVVFIAPVVGG